MTNPKAHRRRSILCAALLVHGSAALGCALEVPDTARLIEQAAVVFAGILAEEELALRTTGANPMVVMQTFSVDVHRVWKGDVPERVIVGSMDVEEFCVGEQRDPRPTLYEPGRAVIVFATSVGNGRYVPIADGIASRPWTVLPGTPESFYSVAWKDGRFEVTTPKGAVQSVEADKINRVVLRTRRESRYEPDLFWEAYTDGVSPALTFPSGASGQDRFVSWVEFEGRSLAGKHQTWREFQAGLDRMRDARGWEQAPAVMWERPRGMKEEGPQDAPQP